MATRDTGTLEGPNTVNEELLLTRRVLRQLVKKIEAFTTSPSYRAVFTIARDHGVIYDGPTITEELAAARRLLDGEPETADAPPAR